MNIKKLLKNKLVVSLFVLLLIAIGIYFIANLNKPKNDQPTQALSEVKKIEASQIRDNVQIVQSNKIYDIGSDKPVITAIIKDTTPLLGKYPFLKRAYKDDLIITTADQTVIYTPSTKSIRDISKVSLYEDLSKSIKK